MKKKRSGQVVLDRSRLQLPLLEQVSLVAAPGCSGDLPKCCANHSTKRRQRRAAMDRRRQLINIAMDFIASKGCEGLRYQEVAKAAGINTATLFYYFSIKEELIHGAMQHLKVEFSKTPGRTVARQTTALEEPKFGSWSLRGSDGTH
jgi:hypothetical protein